MRKPRLVAVAFVFAGGVIAQSPSPRPAGESARAWSPAEAQAMALATWLAEASRVGGAAKLPNEQRMVRGYRMLVAGRDRDGVWRLEGQNRVRSGRGGAGDLLHYFVPDGSDDGARRVVCVRSDGVVAFTDNEKGTGRPGGRELAAHDALAGGGQGTPSDFPRAPTIGGDRNLWLPADQAPRASLRVAVVSEDGVALGAIGVATVVVAPENTIDAPLPAAFARTLHEGDATLQGVPARGLGFVVTIGNTTLALPSASVRFDGSTARVTVPARLLQGLRASTNEAAAIAMLKNIGSAQAQCQASGVIDVNDNGDGEYGTFAELSGRDRVRGGKAPISPPVLSTTFQKIENGVVVRNGYCFRMVLPGPGGAPVPELARGGADAAAIDAWQAETVWCCFAWPAEAGATGNRCFFVNQAGDVLACTNTDGRYSGAKGPSNDAAFAAESDGRLAAAIAANRRARDGQTWTVVP